MGSVCANWNKSTIVIFFPVYFHSAFGLTVTRNKSSNVCQLFVLNLLLISWFTVLKLPSCLHMQIGLGTTYTGVCWSFLFVYYTDTVVQGCIIVESGWYDIWYMISSWYEEWLCATASAGSSVLETLCVLSLGRESLGVTFYFIIIFLWGLLWSLNIEWVTF